MSGVVVCATNRAGLQGAAPLSAVASSQTGKGPVACPCGIHPQDPLFQGFFSLFVRGQRRNQWNALPSSDNCNCNIVPGRYVTPNTTSLLLLQVLGEDRWLPSILRIPIPYLPPPYLPPAHTRRSCNLLAAESPSPASSCRQYTRQQPSQGATKTGALGALTQSLNTPSPVKARHRGSPDRRHFDAGEFSKHQPSPAQLHEPAPRA